MIKTHLIRLSRAEWYVYVEMMEPIGACTNPMVGMTVAVAVQEAMNK